MEKSSHQGRGGKMNLARSTKTNSFDDKVRRKIFIKAVKAATTEAERLSKTSSIISLDDYQSLSRYNFEEIEIGVLLGQGGFSDVFEVNSIKLLPKVNGKEIGESRELIEQSNGVVELSHNSRTYMSQNFRRGPNNDARYAIKYLSKESFGDETELRKGAIDLTIESLFLASLHHPNIIKIRGFCEDGIHSFFTCPIGYFTIMDRLYETLDQRIHNTWTSSVKQLKKKMSLKEKLAEKAKKEFPNSLYKLLAERLFVAHNIASAIFYLHENNIIYRDLKPDNVGFDVRGNVKLFDFGLVKEITPRMIEQQQRENPGCDDPSMCFYKLSGDTGTRRYMAPEIAKYMPYNFLVDAYSFGILLWEIITLQKPFDKLDANAHSERVVYGNERPKLNLLWWDSSHTLQDLIKCCWSEKCNERPNFGEILEILRRKTIHYHGNNSLFSFERKRGSMPDMRPFIIKE